VRQLNDGMAAVAAANRAQFADIFPAINLALPNEVASVCAFTGVCTPLQDIHPTDAGYANIAGVLWSSSGYAKLGG
jgi:hypothetical protein